MYCTAAEGTYTAQEKATHADDSLTCGCAAIVATLYGGDLCLALVTGRTYCTVDTTATASLGTRLAM